MVMKGIKTSVWKTSFSSLLLVAKFNTTLLMRIGQNVYMYIVYTIILFIIHLFMNSCIAGILSFYQPTLLTIKLSCN